MQYKTGTYKLIGKNSETFLNDEMIAKSDCLRIDKNRFNLIENDKGYNLQLVDKNFIEKEYKIEIENEVYYIKIKDEIDQMLDSLGLSGKTIKKINELKAPMPGMVLEIFVKEGDFIKTGDKLMILEAMKMENILKADFEGEISEILIEKGKAVTKGQILIKLK
jgi:biotin carboxyl carrier protein